MHKTVVMIIDREPFFRAGLRQALSQQEGLEVLECDPEEGKAATEKIAVSSPDVALVDIGYPTLMGLDLGKKIARSFPATKVVMMSANPNDDDEELFEVIKSGAVAYLRSKDCSQAKLMDTIKRASHGEYPINDSVSSRPKVAWRVLRQFQDIAAIGMTIEDIARMK